MSDIDAEPGGAPVDPSGLGPEVKQSILDRYDVAQKAGGLAAPVLTALLAFFVGGLVVLITTGKNPLATYRAIFEGAGFNWFFPWVSGAARTSASLNLQQTLIITTTLILTGLAVAFAFRCGLFNIGGQGQYLVGAILAVWVGSSFEGLNPFIHVVISIVAGALCGALWAGIAGILKGTKHAAEARKLIDFLTGITVQEDLQLNMFVFPANTKATLAKAFVDFAAQPADPLTMSPAAIAADRETWIDEWTKTVL